MLAYLVISVELAILYTVFWYVFLREPKPYRIKGNAWGAYDGPAQETDASIKKFAMFGGSLSNGQDNDWTTRAHSDNCTCQAEQSSKNAKDRSASAIYEEWNVPLTAGELIRSQTRGVERIDRHPHTTQENNLQRVQNSYAAAYGEQAAHSYAHSYNHAQTAYAPGNPTEQYRPRPKSKTLPGFLAELGDKLNRINVKLP